MALALVILAAIADHAFGWGTGVAACLTVHSFWRQRRMEARLQRQLERSTAPQPDPWPPGWAADWRPSASQPTSRRNYQ